MGRPEKFNWVVIRDVYMTHGCNARITAEKTGANRDHILKVAKKENWRAQYRGLLEQSKATNLALTGAKIDENLARHSRVADSLLALVEKKIAEAAAEPDLSLRTLADAIDKLASAMQKGAFVSRQARGIVEDAPSVGRGGEKETGVRYEVVVMDGEPVLPENKMKDVG